MPLTYHYADLAASVQLYLENCISSLITTSYSKYNLNTEYGLVLSGGVALNCKSNMSISDKYRDHFCKIWSFPASGDSGSSIGACMHYLIEKLSPTSYTFNGMLLGPCPDSLVSDSLAYSDIDLRDLDDASLERLCVYLREGKVGAICSSHSEFGPRALGNRSIIADPTNINSLSFINSKVKQREDFRPLAPAILKEYAFDYYHLNPITTDMYSYMLSLAKYKDYTSKYCQPNDKNNPISPCVDSSIELSSVVHVDGTSRLQIVDSDQDTMLLRILRKFNELYSIPVLINTSLNVRGEPIVQSIDDAISCFKECELDFIVIDSKVVFRDDLPSYLLLKTGREFELD